MGIVRRLCNEEIEMNAPIRFSSLSARIARVEPYGFPMECEYEYDEGEPAIYWPTDAAHPGSPPNVTLLACQVGGVNVYEMLSNDQIERIEEAILELIEEF
jgi:hypothetical protein